MRYYRICFKVPTSQREIVLLIQDHTIETAISRGLTELPIGSSKFWYQEYLPGPIPQLWRELDPGTTY